MLHLTQIFYICVHKYFYGFQDEVHSEYRIMEGHFVTPFKKFLPEVVPDEVEIAK